MSERVYIGLGSNLGDRLGYLQSARNAVGLIEPIVAESPVYETEPWGVSEPQPSYLNCVLAIDTLIEPVPLLARLQAVEKSLGRGAHERNSSRVIDLDILLYGSRVMFDAEADLTIPHPRLHERAFVLVPLADIAPEVLHPVLGRTVSQLLDEVDVSAVHLWRPT